MAHAPSILPLGDSALTIDFGNEISVSLNERAVTLATRLDHDRFPGFVEAVPAYASVTVFYDVAVVRRSFPDNSSGFEAVKNFIASLASELESPTPETKLIEIPADFGAEASLDIQSIAEFSGLDRAAVIGIFTSRTYRVFMLGFLPGFTYMGEVDERIAIPRKSTPRTSVPKGSIGIAGKQTGVYPLESPGGWQIIGRTDVELFRPAEDPTCLLSPGDHVRFVHVPR